MCIYECVATAMSDNSQCENKSTADSAGTAASPEICKNSDFDSTSMLEENLIDNMTCFLEANGAIELDKDVLRNMAISLTRCLNE